MERVYLMSAKSFKKQVYLMLHINYTYLLM